MGGHGRPHVAIDYGYLHDGDQGEGGSRPGGTAVLFGIEAVTGLCLAMMVPGKGLSVPWVAKRIAAWIDRLGSTRAVVKADNEPAITALVDEVRRQRADGSITVPDNSETGESQCNHLAEGAVNTLKGLIRTWIDALEKRLGAKLGPRDP